MIDKSLKIYFKNRLLIILFLIMCFFVPHVSHAATMSISPSYSKVSVGKLVTVKVFIDTSGKSINNGEATIQFPKDMLDVTSVAKKSSIFSLWLVEPSFSNTTGKIIFNGGVPNPGYVGSSGYIASVTFKAKKQGTASIVFADGAVRENDGFGTDVLTTKNDGTIYITKPLKEEVKTPLITKDADKDIIPIINTFSPSIRLDGNHGIIKLSDENIISNIEYYTISIDNAPNFKIKKDQLINYEYPLDILSEGNHNITVTSFDRSGQYIDYSLSFMSPAISIPVLSLSADNINVDSSVIITGKTNYPNSKVNVILELNNREVKKYEQITGLDGSFFITTDDMQESGLINIWAENILSDSVKSGPSAKVYLKVNEKVIVKLTLSILYPFFYFILIFIIVSLLFVSIYIGWHKFFILKKRVENESEQAIIEIHESMLLLKDDLKRQLESLETIKTDRSLEKGEEIIFKEIVKNIDNIDLFIKQKLTKVK